MRKIFDDSMETKFTVRLDKKHLEILDEIMNKLKLKSKSEVVRYLIEKEKNKIKK